jgi:hypothetical protein
MIKKGDNWVWDGDPLALVCIVLVAGDGNLGIDDSDVSKAARMGRARAPWQIWTDG